MCAFLRRGYLKKNSYGTSKTPMVYCNNKVAKSPIPVIPAGPVPVKTGSLNQGISENTGCRIKPGMTPKLFSGFMRYHQKWD